MKERNEMGVCGLKSSHDVQHRNYENLKLEDTDGIIRDTSVITHTVQILNLKYETSACNSSAPFTFFRR